MCCSPLRRRSTTGMVTTAGTGAVLPGERSTLVPGGVEGTARPEEGLGTMHWARPLLTSASLVLGDGALCSRPMLLVPPPSVAESSRPGRESHPVVGVGMVVGCWGVLAMPMGLTVAGKPCNETRRDDGVLGRIRVACVVCVEGTSRRWGANGASNVKDRRALATINQVLIVGMACTFGSTHCVLEMICVRVIFTFVVQVMLADEVRLVAYFVRMCNPKPAVSRCCQGCCCTANLLKSCYKSGEQTCIEEYGKSMAVWENPPKSLDEACSCKIVFSSSFGACRPQSNYHSSCFILLAIPRRYPQHAAAPSSAHPSHPISTSCQVQNTKTHLHSGCCAFTIRCRVVAAVYIHGYGVVATLTRRLCSSTNAVCTCARVATCCCSLEEHTRDLSALGQHFRRLNTTSHPIHHHAQGSAYTAASSSMPTLHLMPF